VTVSQPIQQAIEIYERNQIDFHSLFAWHLYHGIIFSNHEGFAMGFRSNSANSDLPVGIEEGDTLFVTMCCGDMRKCLSAFQNDFKFIAFRRSFKNSPMVRTYPMERFIKTLNK
jgi:hypothetical protein